MAAERLRRRAVCVLGLIPALAAVVLPAPADACSCVGPFISFVAPADGATGVPLNSRIWIGAGEIFDAAPQGMVELHDDDGTIRNGGWTVIEAPGGKLHVFTPAAELEPNRRYQILVGGERRSSFTTGAARDEEAPPVPVITGQEEDSERSTFLASNSCGDWAHLVLTVASDAPVLVLDRARTSALDATALHGEVTELRVGEGTSERTMVVGEGACLSNWPGAGRGESTEVRLGAFDLAGNFSGFGAPEEVGFSSCGCSSGSGAFAWLGLMGALALRRRAGR